MSTYLITGASRGLGLAFVKKLAGSDTTSQVIATCRNPQSAEALLAVEKSSNGKVIVLELDVTSEDQAKKVSGALDELLPNGLDYLVNNAGINRAMEPALQIPASEFVRMFQTNCAGVHNVTMALIPHLLRGKAHKVVNITSQIGSSAMAVGYPLAAYATSKSALNYLTKQYSAEFSKDGLIFLALDPGYLKTDMGGPQATDDPDQVAAALLDIAHDAKEDKNGIFIQWDGKVLSY